MVYGKAIEITLGKQSNKKNARQSEKTSKSVRENI